jgi:hypothetical protein
MKKSLNLKTSLGRVHLILFIILGFSNTAFCQNAEMADGMRSEGKIYVVVAIILIILSGFLLYLLLQDRKLSRIEKLLRDREKPN